MGLGKARMHICDNQVGGHCVSPSASKLIVTHTSITPTDRIVDLKKDKFTLGEDLIMDG